MAIVTGSLLPWVTEFFKKKYPTLSGHTVLVVLSLIAGVLFTVYNWYTPADLKSLVALFITSTTGTATAVYTWFLKNNAVK